MVHGVKNIAQVAVRAMRKAGRRYAEVSGGWAPWWMPEATMRDAIGNAIFQKMDLLVTPEVSYKELKERAPDAEARGRAARNASQGRVDLCVWS